ncbi:MAG: hypothetical protein ACSLFP_07550 [Acidimicrobiales bacterium]
MRQPGSLASLVMAAVLAAGTAGCGGADGSGASDPREAYVAAVASAFTSGNGGPAVADDVAECVGAAMVDLVGASALTSRGVSAQDLADATDLRSLGVPLPDDAEQALAAALGDCGLAGALVGPVAEQIAVDLDLTLTDDQARCVVATVDPRAFEVALAATFVDRAVGPAGFDSVLDAVRSCMDVPA